MQQTVAKKLELSMREMEVSNKQKVTKLEKSVQENNEIAMGKMKEDLDEEIVKVMKETKRV